MTAWTFNSIWASAILHMLWNINGLLNITTQDDHWGVYQYILETRLEKFHRYYSIIFHIAFKNNFNEPFY